MKKPLLALLLAALTIFCACGKGQTKEEKQKDALAPYDKYDDYAENGRYGGRELLKEAVICVARAYYNHRAYIEYDALMTDGARASRPRYEFATPEEASFQRNVYFDSVSFCRNVYNTAFGYMPPDANQALDPGYKNEQGERILLRTGNGADNKTMEESLLKNTLQCGDIIYYDFEDGVNAMLYLSDGEIMYCSFNPSGGSYDYSECHDKTETSSLFLTTLDEALSSRDLFSENKRVCILRPFETGLTVNENTLCRIQKLGELYITKTTSAPRGVSVSPGGAAQITVTVRNLGKTLKKVTVSDSAPEYTRIETDEPFPVTLSVPAGESKSVNYTVRIDESCPCGTTLSFNNTRVGEMTICDTPVLVGNTLTPDEQEAFSSLSVSDISAKTEQELIADLYLKALSKTVQVLSPKDAFSALFEPLGEEGGNEESETAESKTAFSLTQNPDSFALKLLVPGQYGGTMLVCDKNRDAARYIRNLNLIPGDVILYSRDGARAHAFVYLGGGYAAALLSGKAVKADSAQMLDKLLGQGCFCVLRPSFGF